MTMINPQTKIAAVIGNHIAHSKSPLIHNHWIKNHDLNAAYHAFSFEEEDLEQMMECFLKLNFSGLNVTIPFKEKIIPFLDEISEEAKICGAVNTIKFNKGKSIGYNTDIFGFLEHFKTSFPESTLKDKKVLLLGAGGAAKALFYGLKLEKIGHITVVNRSNSRAEELLNHFSFSNSNFLSWDEVGRYLNEYDLIVNSTSLGMKNNPQIEFDLSKLPSQTIIYDIVYNKETTKLLKEAKKHNLRHIDGLGMLLHQARPAFQHWFGILPNIDRDLEEKIKK